MKGGAGREGDRENEVEIAASEIAVTPTARMD